MTPIWTISLILGVSVAKTPIIDAKHSLLQPKPVLIVVVRDLAETDPAIQKIARAEAIRIMDKAGIELLWIDANGSEDPHLPSGAKSYVTVVVLDLAPSGWNKPDAMGFAPIRTGPSPRAYIFSSLISAFLQNFTITSKSDFAVILGHTIVHELGHLVIPGDAHGDGIMTPKWGYREWQQALEGSLLFRPSQARVLRQRLQSN